MSFCNLSLKELGSAAHSAEKPPDAGSSSDKKGLRRWPGMCGARGRVACQRSSVYDNVTMVAPNGKPSFEDVLVFQDEEELRREAKSKGWVPFVNQSTGERGFRIPEVPDSVVYASWERGLASLPTAEEWLKSGGRELKDRAKGIPFMGSTPTACSSHPAEAPLELAENSCQCSPSRPSQGSCLRTSGFIPTHTDPRELLVPSPNHVHSISSLASDGETCCENEDIILQPHEERHRKSESVSRRLQGEELRIRHIREEDSRRQAENSKLHDAFISSRRNEDEDALIALRMQQERDTMSRIAEERRRENYRLEFQYRRAQEEAAASMAAIAGASRKKQQDAQCETRAILNAARRSAEDESRRRADEAARLRRTQDDARLSALRRQQQIDDDDQRRDITRYQQSRKQADKIIGIAEQVRFYTTREHEFLQRACSRQGKDGTGTKTLVQGCRGQEWSSHHEVDWHHANNSNHDIAWGYADLDVHRPDGQNHQYEANVNFYPQEPLTCPVSSRFGGWPELATSDSADTMTPIASEGEERDAERVQTNTSSMNDNLV